MTSVDLMIASASSPLRSFSARTGISGNDRRQRLIADAQVYLGEKAVSAHLLDEPVQTVACAQADQRFILVSSKRAVACIWLLPGHQAVDLDLGHAMVTTFRPRGSHMSGVDPSFQRRVRDPKGSAVVLTVTSAIRFLSPGNRSKAYHRAPPPPAPGARS